MGDLLKSLQDSGGLFGTIAAAAFGLWWFVTRALPAINSNMAGIAKENVSRSDMIEVLRAERDAALAREDAADARYRDLLKDWADMKGQFKLIETDLNRANQLISELKSQLMEATATINAMRNDVANLTTHVKGGQDA